MANEEWKTVLVFENLEDTPLHEVTHILTKALTIHGPRCKLTHLCCRLHLMRPETPCESAARHKEQAAHSEGQARRRAQAQKVLDDIEAEELA